MVVFHMHLHLCSYLHLFCINLVITERILRYHLTRIIFTVIRDFDIDCKLSFFGRACSSFYF